MNLARSAPALLAALLGAACSSAPPPPPIVARAPEPTPPSAPPPPPLAPARWVDSGGATVIGPVVGEDTWVLLGGRRALVSKDGAVKTELRACPEPLFELAEVPSARGTRLVGRGHHGLYRFDDPLGAPTPLAHSEGELARLGAAPGVLAFWTTRSDLPRFVDVETGAPVPLAGLPEPPLRSIRYLDTKRGAAVFEAAGLAITTDGGASWKIATDTGTGDALRASGLRRRGDTLRAFAYAEGPDAAVDLGAARMGPLERPSAPDAEPRLLRWIRRTARDPLEAIAAAGVDLHEHGALIASHGQLARVDPATGSLLDLSEFAHGKDMSACGTSRAGDAAFIACYLSDEQVVKNLFDPYGVLRVPLAQSALDAGRPELIRNGEAELRGGPSGAVMLLGPCSTESEGEACVRQPDGKWATFHSDVDLGTRGTGPLADGRIAIVRGLFDGDEASEADQGEVAAAPVAVAGNEDEAPRVHRIHLALRDASGKEQALPAITLNGSRDDLRIHSPIEEGLDHALHLVIESSEGLFSVVQSPARESASVQAIPGAFAARIRGGKGIAVGEARAMASLDGGLSWSEIPAPPRLFRDLDAHSYAVDDPTFLVVSELGAKIDTHLRLGWGPSSAPLDEPPSAEGPRLPTPRVQDRGPARVLSCKSEGPAQSAPPLLGSAQVKPLLASKAPPKGTRREGNGWASGRASMLDTIALLEEEGPDKKGAPPATWSLRWHDPSEIGGKPRSWTGPVVAGTTWGTGLRFAAASGARALFVLRRNQNTTPVLVRVSPNGKAEQLQVTDDLLPAGEVVFASDKSEAIAWIRDATLIAWLPGEPPRAIAQLATHAVRTLGQPTRDGVPLLLGSADWALTRTVPIPPFDKKSATRPPPPAAPSLDGWARLPFLARDAASFPACAASPKGARFVIQRGTMAAQVDGVDESGTLALYDLRISGNDACVAGLSAFLSPDRRARTPAPSAAKPAAKGATTPPRGAGPVAFVRADFAGKRAEGGDRGVAPSSVRRLSCALLAKP
jgi:hypothetical protein